MFLWNLNALYRIGKDTKHKCLILVWKLTDYGVILEPFFLWNISLWNESHIQENYLKTLKKTTTADFSCLQLRLRTMCLHAEKCTWFFTIFSWLYNGLSPSFHWFVISRIRLIKQNTNTGYDYSVSSTNPVQYLQMVWLYMALWKAMLDHHAYKKQKEKYHNWISVPTAIHHDGQKLSSPGIKLSLPLKS